MANRSQAGDVERLHAELEKLRAEDRWLNWLKLVGLVVGVLALLFVLLQLTGVGPGL